MLLQLRYHALVVITLKKEALSSDCYNLKQIQLATAHSNKSHVKDEALQTYLATALADE